MEAARSLSRAATTGRNLWTPSLQGARKPGRAARSAHTLGGDQVEGRQAVRELLAAGRREVREIWMTEGSDPSPILGEIDLLARERHVPVRLVSVRRLESIQGTEAPQGVVAFADPLEAVTLDQLVFGSDTRAARAWRLGQAQSGSGQDLDEAEEGVGEIEPFIDVADEPDEAADDQIDPPDSAAADKEADPAAFEGAAIDEESGHPDDASAAGELDGDQPDDERDEGEGDSADEALVAQASGDPGTGASVHPPIQAGAFLVLLDGVTDPQNLGAILRSAECAGATGVVIPRHRAAHVTPAVTKAAAGAIEHLPMALVAGIPSALQELERLGVMTVGLDERGTTTLFDLDVKDRPVALVLGAEGRGLAPLARRRCEVLAKIPMGGEIDSLNVSAAAAVACFQVARQRARARGK